jgi:ABC-2 type transport system ATP-binding protein
MSTPDAAVVVRDLVKQYPKRTTRAVNELSFSVPRGEIFGLLGPNGAGKTTTIGILTTLVTATSGSAYIAGTDVTRDPATARGQLAVVTQHNNLDRAITVRQNLLVHGIYHNIRRAERHRRADVLLDQLGLTEYASSRPDRLSGGQQQRVKIARSLMHHPSVLFVDEPSTGLDPQARLFVYDMLAELNKGGTTVVLTTHDMTEARRLCDRVGIVDHGSLIALDTPAALTSAVAGATTVTLTVDGRGLTADDVHAALRQVDGFTSVDRMDGDHDGGVGTAGLGDRVEPPGRFRLQSRKDPTGPLAAALAVLHERGCEVVDMEASKPSLEDVFIDLTGRGLR